jgi:hypothetical protein
MRHFKDVKKEIFDFIESYKENQKINVHAEITQINDSVKIEIYEEVSSGHVFYSHPNPKSKVLPQNEFLQLNNQEIHKLITNIIEDDIEETPFYGPRIDL